MLASNNERECSSLFFFFCKQKTAYEMSISDGSSDVCSSDLEARGMTMHESQSLMIEMQASRSRDFLTFLAPLAREAFGGSGPAWQADNLLRHYTAVKPDFIRVDADEVTYPAHVILRYRLEKALIAGDMSLDDLPGGRNRGMQALLRITPPADRPRCPTAAHGSRAPPAPSP